MRILFASLALVLTLGLTAQAAVFPCASGDVPCLIAAIGKANSNGEPNMIRLEAGTYTLTTPDHTDGEGATGLPMVTSTLTIQGAGAGQTILERQEEAALFRLLQVDQAGALTLEHLTIQRGAVEVGFFQRGGGITTVGTLTLKASVVTDCAAWLGGGIFGRGPVVLQASAMVDNHADLVGGGIAAAGPLTVTESYIADNTADGESGLAIGESLILTRSVVTGNIASLDAGAGVGGLGTLMIQDAVLVENVAVGSGGGLALEDGLLTVVRSLVAANHAGDLGGGVFLRQGTAHLARTVITRNTVGLGRAAGLYNEQGAVTLHNSVLVGNQAPASPECGGEVTLSGRTVIGDPSGCTLRAR